MKKDKPFALSMSKGESVMVRQAHHDRTVGKVFLVGAGPGDPELITRRGAALMRRADCVVYDRLVSPKLVELTKVRCERIYAGKEPDEGGRSQNRINRLMVERAHRGETVVRLKGGDPMLFGRISEEMEALHAAGVPFEIVPGVSSPWAAAATLGIPLTDRRVSSSVAFVTGHEAAGKTPSVRWEQLARGVDTLVILMGSTALPKIVRRLRVVRPDSTPVAVVRWASTSGQGLWVSTLRQIEQDLKKQPGFGPPAIVIVGEVVRLVQAVAPVGARPLEGKKVLITRPASDSGGLLQRLRELGATCRALPTIEIRPRRITAREAKELLERLPGYDWVLFNSHHGVEMLDQLARRGGRPLRRLILGKVCTIGPRTEEAVRIVGLKADLVPTDFSIEGVRKAFERMALRGKRILIPRSNLAMGDPLAQGLRKRGARVDEMAVYKTVFVKIPAGQLKKALRDVDAVTFTSASTVRSFLQSVKGTGVSLHRVLNGAAVAAIGPATAKALKQAGVRQFHLPDGSWTIDGLVAAIVSAIRPAPGCP